jgi:RNA polymerase sigma-70 factor (ECF subfamily)
MRRRATEEELVQTADPRHGPDAHTRATELYGHLRRLIDRLPAALRDALLLARAGDYTYDEIAAMLDIPVGTLKWRVSEARRKLRIELALLGYDERS